MFPRNAPLLDRPVIYARDLGPRKNMELIRRYPERRFFRLVAMEDYRLEPYRPELLARGPSYALPATGSLTVEITTHQASAFRDAAGSQLTDADSIAPFRAAARAHLLRLHTALGRIDAQVVADIEQ